MPLLNPGDPFPRLTLNIPGARAVQVPGALAGEFAVMLFNRGAWCPYCTAQLRAFQRARESRPRLPAVHRLRAGSAGQGDRERVLKRRHRPPDAR